MFVIKTNFTLTPAKTVPKSYLTVTWGLFYSHIGYICTKYCIYVPNIAYISPISPICYRILSFLPVNVAESMFANYVNGRYIKNSKSRNMTMVDSVYVNVIRKSNNSANNSSHGIPTKYRFGPCQWALFS